ncbi:anaphase-promoting complex subunit 2 [[Candida] anglica]|uniref:Anaphase-promoting complex subunit 2 n=1 Tax=[Candida] anglica TaxID=148631 RepID=A0ABP0EN72_9ASCO
MSLPLTRDLMEKILSAPTLYNHNYDQFAEIENDVQLLLDWLDPCFPSPQNVFIEPTPRVKSAIRSCLKDDRSQLDFIHLYNNSITTMFREHSQVFVQENFLDLVKTIHQIKQYYEEYLRYLNLGQLAANLFERNLNALFYTHLLDSDNDFTSIMRQYFSSSLFSSVQKSQLTQCISILYSCGLRDEVNGHIVSISIERIKTYIHGVCSGVWDKPVLNQINDWVRLELYIYFSIIIPKSELDSQYLSDLTKIAHDELVSLRISEIFDIVLDFPHSQIALDELHRCILPSRNIGDSYLLASLSVPLLSSQSFQREKLVNKFIEMCQDRILHSGADTIDVVICYTSTIKSFLIIDPKGVILDKVVRPIRRYLKTRSDIISKLVHGLLDDSKNNRLIELAMELRKIPQKNPTNDDLDLNWIPDPIDALPDFKKGKVSDVIESLVSIFDSKVVFTNEFTQLFGHKLLNLRDYDVSDIVESLKLLKLRFGENKFTTLEIMIRDIIDSKQTNENIFQGKKTSMGTVYHPKILSHMYWSMLTEEELKIPEHIEKQFQEYSKYYRDVKYGRGLKLVPSLGLVKLELEFENDVKAYFEVSPSEATVIYLFDGKNQLTTNEICEKTGMNTYNALKAVEYWISREILIEISKDVFAPTLVAPKQSLDEGSSSSRSGSTVFAHKFASIDTIWPFITGMLTNLGPLPVVKIQSFLNITVPKEQQELYSQSNVSLTEYLDWCREEGRLEMTGSLYKIKK